MKNKKELFIILIALITLSCSKDHATISTQEDDSTAETVSHEMIVLGEQLEDPYSVKNITKAVADIYPTRAARVDVHPTDVYLRFLPANEKEYDYLKSLGIEMLDHPLDYKIIKDGDYYHDPALPQNVVTWQYCVVPHDFKIPENIKHEILDRCFIPEHSRTRAENEGIDWEAVEAQSYKLTGNAELLVPKTKGGQSKPEGRITIVDDKYADGKPFGVAGVKVVCNSFVKFSSAYTNRDGYYSIPKSYFTKVRYRLLFTNSKGFSIGFNKILIPASTSTLGRKEPTGLDVVINRNSERKLFSRCVVNNAAYDYISRCSADDMNIPLPPSDLRIWIFQKLSSSSTIMLHHGAIVDKVLVGKYLGCFSFVVKWFLPDLTLGLSDSDDYASIYAVTTHEMAHTSHFSRVGKEYWYNYANYIVSSFITSGGVAYGDGSNRFAGHCEIGETWAYFMENLIYNQRYGGTMIKYGLNYWFKPQLFKSLYDRGLSLSKIINALDADVTDRDELRRRLVSRYPENAAMIEQIFRRY